MLGGLSSSPDGRIVVRFHFLLVKKLIFPLSMLFCLLLVNFPSVEPPSVDVFDRVTLLLFPSIPPASSAHYYRTIPSSVKAKASGLSPLQTFLVVSGAIAFFFLLFFRIS